MAEIEKIYWKRTYLLIEYRAPQEMDISLRDEMGRQHLFRQKPLEEGRFRAKLNVCIVDGRQMLESGEWMICMGQESDLAVSHDILLHFETLSNVFRYDGDKAYIVTFHLTETMKDRFAIRLQVDYMMRNPHPEKRYDKLFLLKTSLNLWYQIVSRLRPKRGNRILFMSENREEMTGNLKAIYDRMQERGLEEHYRLDKSFRNIFKQKQSPFDWLKTVTKIATHDFVFVEDYVPVFGFLKMDPKTTLVQTWHAGFGFKSVGYGRFGLNGSPNPFHSCHRNYTYALVGNENLKEIYSEVFGIEEEALLPTGMPRLSHFLDQDVMDNTKNRLYQDMPFLKDKRVITFAPTYRGSNQKEAYYDMDKIDQKQLYEFCEKNQAVILFKFHPFLKGQSLLDEQYQKYLIDLSQYDLNDLFYITDVLITDYSSCFYDYILLGKPVLFYVYDEESYSATRGVHRPVSKVAPGKICRTFDALIEALEQSEYEEVDIPSFMIDRCAERQEQTASDKVIDEVILKKKD